VPAIFWWSHHSLTPPAARLFRLLPLHPGPGARGQCGGGGRTRLRRHADRTSAAGRARDSDARPGPRRPASGSRPTPRVRHRAKRRGGHPNETPRSPGYAAFGWTDRT
jgi:hypothetical protein